MSVDQSDIVSDDTVDERTSNLAQQRLSLADDVVVWPIWQADERVYQIEVRKLKRFYQIGTSEYVFLSLLNGDRTVASACGLAAAQLADKALSIDQCESIAKWMIQERIATLDDGAFTTGDSTHQSNHTAGEWFQQFNPFWIRLPLIRNRKLLNRITQPFCRFARPSVLFVLAVLIAIGGVLFHRHHEAVTDSAADFFSPSGWLAFLGTWVALKGIHEFGHMLACRCVKGETTELGVVLILFAPLAYVDVSSCWRMTRRMDRVFVSLAGMFIELVIASLAMVVWVNSTDPSIQFYMANIVITAGISTLLFNANPLMRFDGYYVVSDLIQIPNLYAEASRAAKNSMERLFLGSRHRGQFQPRQSQPGQRYRGLRLWFLLVYGCLAFLWRVFICVSLCLAACIMFSGAGLIIAALGLWLWLKRPVKDLVSEISHRWHQDWIAIVRCGMVAGVTTASIIGLSLCPAPSPVVVPGVVYNPADSLVRAGADGFVQQIKIRSGQMVRKGDLLLVLDNDHLHHQLNQLRFDLLEKEMELRIATDQHDAATAWILRNDCESLNRQVNQLAPKVSALQILAPCDGVIQSRELMLLEGTFLSEGTEIAHVINGDAIEVRGMVQQDYVAYARSQIGQTVMLRDPAQNQFQGSLKAINPRATHTLSDLSLSATIGGDLEVLKQGDDENDRETIQGSESSVRLAEPHFVVRVELQDRQPEYLKSGMRVRIDIGNRQEPIAQRIAARLETLVYQTRAAMRQ